MRTIIVLTREQAEQWDAIMEKITDGCINKVYIRGTEFIKVVKCSECKHRDACGNISGNPDEWYCADGERE